MALQGNLDRVLFASAQQIEGGSHSRAGQFWRAPHLDATAGPTHLQPGRHQPIPRRQRRVCAGAGRLQPLTPAARSPGCLNVDGHMPSHGIAAVQNGGLLTSQRSVPDLCTKSVLRCDEIWQPDRLRYQCGSTRKLVINIEFEIFSGHSGKPCFVV
jgi:hypothetical protein